MKYCPYCGASLAGGAAPFCAECGESLRFSGKKPTKEKKTGNKRAGKGFPPEPEPPDPRDEDYDGYYDDVLPSDDGHTRDRLDPEIVKRAVLIAAGTLVIVVLSVILMYLL